MKPFHVFLWSLAFVDHAKDGGIGGGGGGREDAAAGDDAGEHPWADRGIGSGAGVVDDEVGVGKVEFAEGSAGAADDQAIGKEGGF